jgi:hypothetical protein
VTLLITVFAAVITTVIWYNRKDDNMKMGILLFMFWGASLMWFVDAVFEYAEYGDPSLGKPWCDESASVSGT